MIQKGLPVVIILLFLVSTVTPMILANTNDTSQKESFDSYLPHSYLARYNPTENRNDSEIVPYHTQTTTPSITKTQNENKMLTFDDGLMNSSWPMYCHDTHHTGRSPYSTANNPPGVIKWSFDTHKVGFYGSTVIDSNGTIYSASNDLYAFYPNGTLKWAFNINGWSETCPAIDENGIIYIGTAIGDPNYFYAIYPNGTMKWRYWFGGSNDIFSSPVIGPDGTIIFADSNNWDIIALYPNGTKKWSYHTGLVVYSSPAIGPDDIVYCGSHDTYLYALYPSNGTLKWRFKTGDWIRVSPCIGDDGTIYCVSTDGYLYAIQPDGTMKWKTWVEAGTSPTIGQDGTIYAGWSKLYAVNPDGSVKWIYESAGGIQGGTPCTSQEGIIYFGTYGGYLIAINPDGTEAWKTYIGQCESAPAIGEDGSIYIGAMYEPGYGRFYAFGSGPLKVEANGPYKGQTGITIQFTGTIYGGKPPYTYNWDFGDGNASGEQNPHYTYKNAGNYSATFTVIDNEGNSSTDTATVSISFANPSLSIVKPGCYLYFMNMNIQPWYTGPFIIGPITIEVEASQIPFGIDRVEFYIDGTLRSTDTSAPYRWTWIKPAFFTHAIKVVAYDTSGNSTIREMTVKKFF
ncbi:MAG: PQQ-binding-like beta-propeller repeat protein [Euryarchaeota archaeon]|nr:PQQ-binding-like beta-propeller repeat protein [Euryarchaeota archaeon]